LPTILILTRNRSGLAKVPKKIAFAPGRSPGWTVLPMSPRYAQALLRHIFIPCDTLVHAGGKIDGIINGEETSPTVGGIAENFECISLSGVGCTVYLLTSETSWV
jgi:hypothetical protein